MMAKSNYAPVNKRTNDLTRFLNDPKKRKALFPSFHKGMPGIGNRQNPFDISPDQFFKKLRGNYRHPGPFPGTYVIGNTLYASGGRFHNDHPIGRIYID